MWVYRLENFSYIALAFGQRQVLLSLLGFALMFVVTWNWRYASVQSLLPAWLWFWVWMLPLSLFASMNPSIGIFNNTLHLLREHVQHWLPLQTLSPCEVPYLDRLSSDFPLYPLLSWHKLVLGLWLLITAEKSFSLLYKRKKLSTIAKNADAIDEPYLIALVENWRRRYRLSRSISVRSSGDCSQAFTIGVIRPIIYLPEHLLRELSSIDIEAVLGHEIAHIKRYDDIFVRFQLITKSILFFNPLIWLSAGRITSLRERSCDLLAIRVGELSAQNYAKSLLRVAELQPAGAKQNSIFDSEVAAGLTSSALAERVGDVLMADGKRFSYWPLLLVVIGLLLLNIIFMPNLSNQSAIRGSEASGLLHSLGAVRPMPRLRDGGNFNENVSSTCSFPTRNQYHPGADFVPGADGDLAVRAIAAGEIAAVNARLPYLGVSVQIKHTNDIVSTYVHLSETNVRPGDQVHAGQQIGMLGDNHLHLEIRKGLRVVDPSVLLNQ